MRINRSFGLLVSAALAAVSTMVLMVSVVVESFNPLRLAVVLAVLIAVHCMRYPRLMFCREFGFYTTLLGFIGLSFLWAPDAALGLNTLIPAVDFVLTLLLFGSLFTYHDLGAVLAGTLGGFLTGAGAYTYLVGFPFVRPEGFSYNGVAGMYLFGLLITLLVGWHSRRRVVPIALEFTWMLLIVATTSIKTNLGVALGAFAAVAFRFRYFVAELRRTAIIVLALGLGIAYWVSSNEALVDRLGGAYDRVSLGVGVLAARDDAQVKGKGLGLQTRESWEKEGLKGWLTSPVLGIGVEGFRADYGITSHSTPVDLLYNFGVVGLILFYSVFASVSLRLWRARGGINDGLCALSLGALACYGFMSLSGTLYYNSFMAAFLAIDVALLMRLRHGGRPVGALARNAHA